MIPKKIHYIWLGKNQKSKLTEICINSWKRNLPDYEIIEWNEDSLNLSEICQNNMFCKKCAELKLWAFVSDYLRLYVLYQHGGIYFDTDVEVLKSFTPLLANHAFLGYEANGYIGTSVIGAEAGNKTIKRLLDFYDNDIWNVNFINNPIIFKYLFGKEREQFSECEFYPQNYFSPYTPGQEYIGTVETENTYSIHWYTNNWNMTRKGYVFTQTKHIRNPIKKYIVSVKKNLGYMKKKLL